MNITKMRMTRYLNAVSIKSKTNSRVNIRALKNGGYELEFVRISKNANINSFVKFNVVKGRLCATELRLSEESAEALFYGLGEMLGLKFETKKVRV